MWGGSDGAQRGVSAEFVAVDALRPDRLSGGLGMHCVSEDPLGYVLVGQLHRGRWRLQAGGQEARLGPGDSMVYPVDAMFQLDAHDFDIRVVSLPMARVSAAAATVGVDPQQLRFESMTPVSPGSVRQLQNTLTLVQQELAGPGSAAATPLVAEQLTQTVAASVLSCFPNTTMTTTPTYRPATAGSAAIRRAIAFIDDHADEPITLADIAAAGITPRTLQAGFARHHKTPPRPAICAALGWIAPITI